MMKVKMKMKIDIKRVLVLTLNTLMKEYHNKTLLMIFIFTIIMLTLGEYLFNMFSSFKLIGVPMFANKMTFFYMLASFWSMVLGVILGATIVRSDFGVGVISEILAWPIKRSEYLLARVLGAIAIIGIYFILVTILLLFFYILNPTGDNAGDLLLLFGRTLAAFFFNLLAIVSIILIGMLFSFYLSKTWTYFAMIFAIILMASAGVRMNEGGWESVNLSSLWSCILAIIYYIFPRTAVSYSLAQDIFFQQTIKFNMLVELIHYLVTTSLLALGIHLLFKRKEF
ncbi:MAG: ABC transporter permease [Oligoflexia bacterium]|nr:ABC transporter permease [Oligoflexia bacterium]